MSFFARSVTKISPIAKATTKAPAIWKPAQRGVVSFARTRTADLPQVFYGRSDVAETGLFGVFRNGLHRFNDLCLRSPNKAATISSATVFFCADASAQYVAHKREGKEFDPTRCLALTTFGAFYYGGVVVRLYRVYDRVLGPKNILAKALFDVTIHTPFGVIPTFYLWTHTLEGRTDSVVDRLENDWLDVSTASVAYWFPVQTTCFAFIPSVHRVAYVSFASFVHKTALSWWAHREPTIEEVEPVVLELTPMEESVMAEHVITAVAGTSKNVSFLPQESSEPQPVRSEPLLLQEVPEPALTETNPEVPHIHETQGCVDGERVELTLGQKLIAHAQGARGLLSYFP